MPRRTNRQAVAAARSVRRLSRGTGPRECRTGSPRRLHTRGDDMKAIRLFETHLAVRDVERSIAFYRDVVGLAVGLRVPERDAAFLWVGARGDSMLGLWSLGSAPLGITSHVAFEALSEDVFGAC